MAICSMPIRSRVCCRRDVIDVINWHSRNQLDLGDAKRSDATGCHGAFPASNCPPGDQEPHQSYDGQPPLGGDSGLSRCQRRGRARQKLATRLSCRISAGTGRRRPKAAVSYAAYPPHLPSRTEMRHGQPSPSTQLADLGEDGLTPGSNAAASSAAASLVVSKRRGSPRMMARFG